MRTSTLRTTFSTIAFAAADIGSGNAPAIGDIVGTVAPEATGVVANVQHKPEASNVAAPKRNAKRTPAAAASATAKAKAGKPAAKPEAEAKPDPRVARAERVAVERSDISALYAAFEADRASIPVKTLSAFKPSATTAHPISRNPSERQAAAICIAVAATGGKLIDGAKAPRVFERNGVRVAIENGVLRDAVSSGLVSVSGSSPETEIITIRAKQAAIIGGLIGASKLKRAKLA